MNSRRKRVAGRRPTPDEKPAPTASPPTTSRAEAPKRISVESALIECVGAICLVEVVMNSLESQELADSEQEVLKRALRPMWFVHDWIYELRLDDGDERGNKP